VVAVVAFAFLVRAVFAVGAAVAVGIPVFGDDELYHLLSAQRADGTSAHWDATQRAIYVATSSFIWTIAALYRVVGAHPVAAALLVAALGAAVAGATGCAPTTR